MALVNVPVPSVVGGVSQQPEHLAGPDRWRDLKNFLPLPETGNIKRPHTTWRTRVQENPAQDLMLVPVDIGGDDKYILALGHRHVGAYFRNGDEVPIFEVTRDADGNITGGSAPNFAYVEGRRPQLLANPDNLRSSGGAWVISGQALDSVLGNGPDVYKRSDMLQYSELRMNASVAPQLSEWIQPINLHLFSGVRKFSVYVNTEVDGGAFRAVNCDRIALGLRDPLDATTYGVQWDFMSGFTEIPEVTSNVGECVPFAEQVGTYEFRLGFYFDPARVTPTGTGNTTQCSISLTQGSAISVAGLYAAQALLETTGEPDSLGSYLAPPEQLRTVQAGATTYVASPFVATRTLATESDDFVDVYGTTTFPGVGGGSDEVGASIAQAGYFFVKQWIASTNYSWRIVVEDTTGAGGTVTMFDGFDTDNTRDTATSSDGGADTSDIAVDIAADINGHVNNTDSGTGGNEAQIVLATVEGSVIKVETKEADGQRWEIVEFQIEDGAGNSATFSWVDDVEVLSDLPLYAQHGTRVRVRADDVDPKEFLATQIVARFIAESGSGFGKGRWAEGTDYGIRTQLDPDTLPHRLTRRQDDVSGTVTGEARSIYFEYSANDWDDRLVGDDTTNGIPSFVTPPAEEGLVDRFVTAVGYSRGRLILTSSFQTVAFSEASGLGNFWRTTTRAVPDSDRIDIESSSSMASPIFGIVEGGGEVYLLAKRGVQVVSFADGILSARTVGLDTVYSGRSNEIAVPVAALNGFMFSQGGDQWDNVRFLANSGNNVFADVDLGADVPRWIGSTITTLEWSAELNLLFAHSRENQPERLAVLRFLPGRGGPTQLAWTRFEFDGAEVQSAASLDDRLYILVDREDGTHLESINLEATQRDVGQDWSVRLDRRIDERDLAVAPSFSSPNTTITLPYDLEAGVTPVVVPRSGASFGVPLTVVSTNTTTPGAHTVTVSGDQTEAELFIGQTYEAWAKPLRPIVKQGARRGGFIPRIADTLSVGTGQIGLEDSAYLDVLVKSDASGATIPTGPGIAPLLNGEGTAAVVVSDTELHFSVGSEPEQFEVTFRNDTHKPSNIVGLEWLVEVVDLGGRVTY